MFENDLIYVGGNRRRAGAHDDVAIASVELRRRGRNRAAFTICGTFIIWLNANIFLLIFNYGKNNHIGFRCRFLHATVGCSADDICFLKLVRVIENIIIMTFQLKAWGKSSENNHLRSVVCFYYSWLVFVNMV